MRRVAKVADILKLKGARVVTAKSTDTVGALADQLRMEKCGAIVVSDHGEVDGIISERDVAYALPTHRGDLHMLPVKDLMTEQVITCSPSDSVSDVARIMNERRIRHLPVTDGDKVVGIIGMRDILMQRLHEVEKRAQMISKLYSAEH